MKGSGLSVTLIKCKTNIATSKVKIKEFIKSIVERVDMKPLGETIIEKGAGHLPGLSAVQLIETSHIALHTFTINNTYMFSIESCKEFDVCSLIDYLLEYFLPEEHKLVCYPIDTVVNVEVEDEKEGWFKRGSGR